MNIHHFYENLLKSLNIVADENGLLSVRNDEGELRPVIIDEKRLTLPLPEILRSGEWGNRIAFHPLSENVLRGTSPVIEKLSTAIRFRLMYTIAGIMMNLVEAAANRGGHSKINPKAASFLQTMPDADEKSVEAMAKILQNIDTDPNFRLISIYLKRGGSYNGERVNRLAKVSFPILKEFERADGTVFGIKLRKKDLIGFKELFNYILPDCDKTETYSGVGTSLVAPYFQSIVDAYIKVATQLNSIIHLQRKQLDDEEFLRIDLDWEPVFLEFEKYRDFIPPLAGNEGALTTEEPTSKTQSAQLKFGNRGTPVASSVFTDAQKTQSTSPVATSKEQVGREKVKVEKTNDFNPDFSLQLREKERKEEEARRGAWGNWNMNSNNAASAPAAVSTDSNASVRSSSGNGLDFNKLVNQRFHQTQGAHFQHHAPVQPGFAGYSQPVVAGNYAGRHRGVSTGMMFNQGFGQPQPMWQANQSHFQGGFGGFGAI